MTRKTSARQSRETNQDPYRKEKKLKNTPICPNCSAIHVRGHWVSRQSFNGKFPEKAVTSPKKTCPACKQLKDKYALGVVELHGERFRKNETQVLNTIRKTEEILRARNDQERILWTSDERGVYRVYVSLPELARQIGRELEKSRKGLTRYQNSARDPHLRVIWDSDSSSRGHEPGAPLELKSKKRKSPDRKTLSRSFRGRGKTSSNS